MCVSRLGFPENSPQLRGLDSPRVQRIILAAALVMGVASSALGMIGLCHGISVPFWGNLEYAEMLVSGAIMISASISGLRPLLTRDQGGKGTAGMPCQPKDGEIPSEEWIQKFSHLGITREDFEEGRACIQNGLVVYYL